MYSVYMQCWQRLQVNADHLDLLRNFPPHFRFLMLQHSEDKCVLCMHYFKPTNFILIAGCRSQLYSAYLIPPQPPAAAPKKGQPPPTAGTYILDESINQSINQQSNYFYSVCLDPVVSRVSVSTGDRQHLLQMVDSNRKLQAQRLLKSQGAAVCQMYMCYSLTLPSLFFTPIVFVHPAAIWMWV